MKASGSFFKEQQRSLSESQLLHRLAQRLVGLRHLFLSGFYGMRQPRQVSLVGIQLSQQLIVQIAWSRYCLQIATQALFVGIHRVALIDELL
jgi:hypothetical protein